MFLEAVIQGLIFYYGWKAVEWGYAFGKNAREQKRTSRERIETINRQAQERQLYSQKVWAAFHADAQKLSDPAASRRDAYATTAWGFLSKTDTQLLLERHPEVRIDLDDCSSSIQRLTFDIESNFNFNHPKSTG